MADFSQTPTFFDISVNTDQIDMGFEADTPWKKKAACSACRLSDKDLVKKVLMNNRIFRLLNQIFVWKSHTLRMLLSIFWGSATNPMPIIWPVLTEISNKVLPESKGFFQKYQPLLLFWSHLILSHDIYYRMDSALN